MAGTRRTATTADENAVLLRTVLVQLAGVGNGVKLDSGAYGTVALAGDDYTVTRERDGSDTYLTVTDKKAPSKGAIDEYQNDPF